FSSRSTYYYSTHTSPAQTYTLSLHDALPIFDFLFDEGAVEERANRRRTLARQAGAARTQPECDLHVPRPAHGRQARVLGTGGAQDRKSTRLNSSHRTISYAVFCLKKKKIKAH